jgi:hypothetical protein
VLVAFEAVQTGASETFLNGCVQYLGSFNWRIIVMHIASIGIDLGKTTFHLVALGERSKVLVRKKLPWSLGR